MVNVKFRLTGYVSQKEQQIALEKELLIVNIMQLVYAKT